MTPGASDEVACPATIRGSGEAERRSGTARPVEAFKSSAVLA